MARMEQGGVRVPTDAAYYFHIINQGSSKMRRIFNALVDRVGFDGDPGDKWYSRADIARLLLQKRLSPYDVELIGRLRDAGVLVERRRHALIGDHDAYDYRLSDDLLTYYSGGRWSPFVDALRPRPEVGGVTDGVHAVARYVRGRLNDAEAARRRRRDEDIDDGDGGDDDDFDYEYA